MSDDVTLDWYDYGDGRMGLLFTPPRLPAFTELGLFGDGHDWQRLLQAYLPRVAPGVLSEMEWDAESDMFVAIHRHPDALNQVAAVVEGLVADPSALRAVLKWVSADT